MSTTTWNLDAAHSEIGFKVKHLMITNVSGTFGKFNVQATSEGTDFTKGQIHFTADINSINTNQEQRDGHLKSGDFFDAEKYPQLKFESTRLEKKDDENYTLHGNLTIKDVTKPVSFAVEHGGITKDLYGQEKSGFSLNGKINRNDFGLTWNAALETGGVVVSEEVKFNAEIQLVKQA